MILLIFLLWIQNLSDAVDKPVDLSEPKIIQFNDFDGCELDYYCQCESCQDDNIMIEIYSEEDWAKELNEERA